MQVRMYHVDLLAPEQLAKTAWKTGPALTHPVYLAAQREDLTVEFTLQPGKATEMEPVSPAIDVPKDVHRTHLGPAARHPAVDVKNRDRLRPARGPHCQTG